MDHLNKHHQLMIDQLVRRNIGVLSESYTVYAIDLLGFGASDKPPGFAYTMETWAQVSACFSLRYMGRDGWPLKSALSWECDPSKKSLLYKLLMKTMVYFLCQAVDT